MLTKRALAKKDFKSDNLSDGHFDEDMFISDDNTSEDENEVIKGKTEAINIKVLLWVVREVEPIEAETIAIYCKK